MKKKKEGKFGPKPFDPFQSKYGIERQQKNEELKVERQMPGSGAPAFLVDEQKVREELEKDYEVANPEDAKAAALLEKLKKLESAPEYRAKTQESDRKRLAEIAEATEKQKRLQTFDRFSQEFVDEHKLDRDLKRMPKLEEKAQKKEPIEQFIHRTNIEEFSKTERLSKRLARMGVCSRR